VTWKEIERGLRIEDFTTTNVPARVGRIGDLWKPLLQARGRFNLGRFV
jgi:bifunctional non-homologous end joining protein LigD